MAVDTISKQWSMKDMLAPWRGPPIPIGATPGAGEAAQAAEEDRLHYLLLYSGITASNPSLTVVTKKSRGALGRQSASHQRHTDQSASGATLTVRTPAGNIRKLLLVTVKYTANATVNVTVTLNSGAGADLNTVIQTIALSATTGGRFIPSGPLIISPDDTIDVFAPLLSSETVSVAIYSEIW